MSVTRDELPAESVSRARRALTGILGTVWTLGRIPVLALLVILEPIVCGALWLLATLGVLTALFYRFLIQDPRFPFWPALGISVGLALLVGLYDLLIRLFGGARD